VSVYITGQQELHILHRLSHQIDTNMFINLSAIFFSAVALAGLVTAVPTDLEARQVTQCNTGSMQCCTTTMEVRIFSSTPVT
jgi:hypothetical protein